MSEPRKHGNGGRWGIVIGIAGVLVAVIALWPSFGSYLLQLNQSPTEPPVAVGTLPPETPEPEPAAAETNPDPAEVAPPVEIPTPVMESIVVGTVYANAAVPCCMVGPGLFELGDDNSTSLGYTWSSRMSDGTENDSDGCAMLITITGPENPPALRKPECSVSRSNGFSNYGNNTNLSTPGVYTITVVDEVSGASGVGEFTVVP